MTEINLENSLEMPWGGYDFSKKTLAVIAYDGRSGIVIHSAGPHIKMEQSEAGLYYIDDMNLEPPCAGIWIWEGGGVWYPGSYECPQDGSYELEGKWRKPNDSEWEKIKNNECPWNDDDWLDPKWKDEILSIQE